MKTDTIVQIIRKFNRDYTAKIGLLEKHVLGSGLTLAESRILLGITQMDPCTLTDLARLLNLDPGFLSRMIESLGQKGLVTKTKSGIDKRASNLHLTDHGLQILAGLDIRSNAQIQSIIDPLSDIEKKQVVDSIQTLNQLLLGEPKAEVRVFITVKNQLDAGDAGRMISMHGEIYQKESGYNHVFEGYVCKTLFEALTKKNTELDRYWLAEVNGELVGSAAIIDRGEGVCQFRWLLVAPEHRRSGLGRTLFHKAMDYAVAGPFQKIYLETTTEQEQAVRMYRNFGFVETARHEIKEWGYDLTGLIMEWVPGHISGNSH